MPLYPIWISPLSAFTGTSGMLAAALFPNNGTGNPGAAAQTFTYLAAGRNIRINDDDAQFDETGDATQTLANNITVDGTAYTAGTAVVPLYSYTLSGSDGSTLSLFAVSFGTGGAVTGVASTAPLQAGVTYTVTSVDSGGSTAYSVLHSVPLDNIIEGSDGDDTIDLNYADDPEGDRVDANDNAAGNNDDVIRAGKGQDTIVLSQGNDTIDGGEGTNTIRGSNERITVTVENAAGATQYSGTVAKAGAGAPHTAIGTDTFTNIQSFAAGEAAGAVDVITLASSVSDRSMVNVSDDAVGTFTPVADASVPFASQTAHPSLAPISFGGEGQPTFNDVLKMNIAGKFQITSGTENGFVDTINIKNFEEINFAVAGGDQIVSGTDQNDYIDLNYLGDPQGDRVDAEDNYAGTHDDVINAGKGDDTIVASRGNDIIDGGVTRVDGTIARDTYKLHEFGGYSIHGAAEYSGTGYSVSYVDDIDGDGKSEILIGIRGQSSSTSSEWPSAWLVSSKDLAKLDEADGKVDGSISLQYVDNPNHAAEDMNSYAFWRPTWKNSGDHDNIRVESAGDVDGDGKGDFMIGSNTLRGVDGGGPFTGQAMLVAGKDLASLDAADGTVDGRIALWPGVVGANHSTHSSGSYSFHYTKPNEHPDYPGSTPQHGTVVGVARAMRSAGDVDGDGKDDILISAKGARYNTPSDGTQGEQGLTWLVSGKDFASLDRADGTEDGQIDLANIVGVNHGVQNSGSYQFTGENSYDATAPGGLADGGRGISVSGVGDVDGDGKSDLVIGHAGAEEVAGSSPYTVGSVYFVSSKDLATLDAADGTSDGNISLAHVSGADHATYSSGSYEFIGARAGAAAGGRVAGFGDVDGDGKADILIGAGDENSHPVYEPGLLYDSGAVYLVSGKDFAALDAVDGAVDGRVDLKNIGANPDISGTSSYKIIGEQRGAHLGEYSVRFAKDVDGDGKDDIVLSPIATNSQGTRHGESYLVSSRDLQALDAADGKIDNRISVENVHGEKHLTHSASSYKFYGLNDSIDVAREINSAGDVDGDGRGDLLIGARGSDVNGTNTGTTYVVLAKDLAALDARDGVVDGRIYLNNQPQGEGDHDTQSGNSYEFLGSATGEKSGTVVREAGDVDGDGKADFFISAADGSGQTRLVLAKDLATFDEADGTRDFKIDLARVGAPDHITAKSAVYEFVAETGGQASLKITEFGDVDGDGKVDFLVNAPGTTEGGVQVGASYLVSGKDLATLDAADGTTDGKISLANVSTSNHTAQGSGSYEFVGGAGDIGYSFSSAGDVDGDGKVDLIIGAKDAGVYLPHPTDPTQPPVFHANAGASYLVSAKDLAKLDQMDGTVDGKIQLSNVHGSTHATDTSGSYKFLGEASNDHAGVVQAAGDLDGDNKADLLITASGATDGGTGAGSVYLVSGKDLATMDAADNTTGAVDGKIELSKVTGADHATISSGSYEIVGESGHTLTAAFAAGDMSGNYRPDIVITAPNADVTETTAGGATVTHSGAGATYLLASSDLASLDALDGTADGKIQISNVYGANHSSSYKFVGEAAGQQSGFSVDARGDSLVIGTNASTGESYLVAKADLAKLDAADGTTDGQISLSNVMGGNPTADKTASYKFVGEASGDHAGYSVNLTGDVDGDGKQDLLIGAPTAGENHSQSGSSYLVSSKDLVALDRADGKEDGQILLTNVAPEVVLKVQVDDSGNGTASKPGLLRATETPGVATGTDTLTSVENFVAPEERLRADEITMTTMVTDRSTVTGLDDNAAGTFTPDAGTLWAGQTVTFGPAGSGATYTFSQLMAVNTPPAESRWLRVTA